MRSSRMRRPRRDWPRRVRWVSTCCANKQKPNSSGGLVVLRKPQNLSGDKALRKLRAADPAGTYEFNHLYSGSGMLGAAERDDALSDAPASIPPRGWG